MKCVVIQFSYKYPIWKTGDNGQNLSFLTKDRLILSWSYWGDASNGCNEVLYRRWEREILLVSHPHWYGGVAAFRHPSPPMQLLYGNAKTTVAVRAYVDTRLIIGWYGQQHISVPEICCISQFTLHIIVPCRHCCAEILQKSCKFR